MVATMLLLKLLDTVVAANGNFASISVFPYYTQLHSIIYVVRP